MCTVISDYNESHSKEVLKNLWEKYIKEEDPKIQRPELKEGNIYKILSAEFDSDGLYFRKNLTEQNWKWFVDNGGYPQSMWKHGSNWSKLWNGYSEIFKMCEIDKALSYGNYFHMPCSQTLPTDCRILLNTTYSLDAFTVMKALFEQQIGDIYSVKFYCAKAVLNKPWKIDKLIVYLPHKNIKAVIKTINGVLNRTRKEINPFCRLEQVIDKPLYFGMAPEETNTSFTIERTKDIIFFLTGNKPAKLSKNMSAVVNCSSKFISEYKSDCDKFVSDCYEFIIARIEKWWEL